MISDIYLKQIRNLIMNRLKGQKSRLFLFGSQVAGKTGHTADIDGAIVPITAFPHGLSSHLREELEESNVPYTVDLVDLSKSNPEFVKSVKKEGVE